MFIPLHDANTLKTIHFPYVNYAFIAINIIVWLFFASTTFIDAETAKWAAISFGFIPSVVNNIAELPVEFAVIPEKLTYVTYTFLHADFMHLAGNMLFIWVFGDNIEDAMGHLRYIVFFLLCAAGAALFHGMVAENSNAPLIGASGAAAGIVAAYLILHPKVRIWILALGRIPLRIPAYMAIGAWVIFQVWNFFANPEDQVSWAAHIGGLISGALLIFVLKRKDVPLFDRGPVNAVAETIAPEDVREEVSPEVPKPPSEKPTPKWGR